MTVQPAFFIPHGGGPCFFMDDPRGDWTELAAFLRTLPDRFPEPPRALIVASCHWEADGFAFTAAERPPLFFDYYGFPPHTYQLRYDAPGAPELAARAAGLLREAGLKASLDTDRGYDHGVFIPLKVALPEADVPIVAMSLDRSLDPALHVAAGRALAPLRGEGVAIIGSGMSFHNMRGFFNPAATEPSEAFDGWLLAAAEAPPPRRDEALADWEKAPAARIAHPREEHLLPLMVAAGASSSPGERIFSGTVARAALSAFRFD